MNKSYQVTLFCTIGAYRPVSCIVNRQQESNIDESQDKIVKKELQKQGIIKICQKRLWTLSDLTKYGYTRYKVRPYEKK